MIFLEFLRGVKFSDKVHHLRIDVVLKFCSLVALQSLKSEE